MLGCLSEVIREGGRCELRKVLIGEKNCKCWLVFDDQLVAPLSLYIHSAFLKTCSLSTWYRLTNYVDLIESLSRAESQRIIVISRPSNASTHLICQLAAGLDAAVKACQSRQMQHDLDIYFLPQRRTHQVARIIGELRQLTPIKKADVHKSGSKLLFKHLAVTISDLNIPVFPIDDILYTLEEPNADFELQRHGDLSPLTRLVDAVLYLLSHGHVLDNALILGLGPSAQFLAREIRNRLDHQMTATTMTTTATTATATTTPTTVTTINAPAGATADDHSNADQHLVTRQMFKEAALKVNEALLLLQPNDTSNPLSIANMVKGEGSRSQEELNSKGSALLHSSSNAAENGTMEKEERIELAIPHGHDDSGTDKYFAALSLTAGLHKISMQARSDSDDVSQLIAQESSFCQARSGTVQDDLFEKVEELTFRIRFPAIQQLDQESKRSNSKPLFNVKTLVILDRKVDWISPFVTPFTYEALLDLVWGIEAGHVPIPAGVIGPEPVRFRLTDSDKVYRNIRALPHTEIGTALHTNAIHMQEAFQKRRPGTGDGGSKWSVEELQSVMSQLKEQQGDHRNLAHHIHIITYIMAQVVKQPVFYTLLRVEDEIISGGSSYEENTRVLRGLCERNYPLADIYRLAILNSCVHADQFDKSAHQALRRKICRTFGLAEIYRWGALEKSGILLQGTTRSSTAVLPGWNALKKALSLSVAGTEDDNEDISFVHSGFSPVLVKVFQAALEEDRRTWNSLTKQSGPDMVVTQCRVRRAKAKPVAANLLNASSAGPQPFPNLHVLIVPGGMSRSEVSACRFISSRLEPRRSLLIVTSGILGYRQLLQQYARDLNNVDSTTTYDQIIKETLP